MGQLNRELRLKSIESLAYGASDSDAAPSEASTAPSVLRCGASTNARERCRCDGAATAQFSIMMCYTDSRGASDRPTALLDPLLKERALAEAAQEVSCPCARTPRTRAARRHA